MKDLDKNPAPDDKLPETGIGYEKEKQLSSRFIQMKGYGTRNTTLVKVDRNGLASIIERNFDEGGQPAESKTINFKVKV